MRAIRTNVIRSRLSVLLNVLLASLAGLCAVAGLMASNVLAALAGCCGVACLVTSQALAVEEPRPPVAIQFSLDRPVDAVAAPFVMASVNGLFSAEGLEIGRAHV